MQLKDGVDKTDFIKVWSSPAAVNQMPTALTDIAAMADNSVTLADIRAVWGIGTATTIVVEQLKGLFYFSEANYKDADVQRKVMQLMQTAGLIVDEFYFLKIQELCCFFRRVKTGMYGQLSWKNNGVNVQQLFCLMREFQRDRKTAYDKIEAERQKNKSLERRCTDYVGAIQNGISGHYDKCEESFDYFKRAFPFLVGSPHASAWWNHFKKDRDKALKDIWALAKATRPK